MAEQDDGESVRSWQLALRDARRSTDFFQAGQSPKKARNKPGFKKSTSKKQKLDETKEIVSQPEDPSSFRKGRVQQKFQHPELMVIEEGDEVQEENEPQLGHLVWAFFRGSSGYFPAIVILGSMVNLATSEPDQAFVFWFSDWKVSAVDRSRMLPFVEYFKTKAVLCRGKQNRRGILQIIQECQRRAVLRGIEIVKMDPLQWAFSGFPTVEDSSPDIFSPVPDKIFSDAISDRLAAIGDDIRKKAALKDRDIQNEFQKESALEAVWRGVSAIENVCIGCCDAGRKVCCEHPLFEGGLCTKCKEVLQETFYAIGDDGGYANCTVCGASGELFVCDVQDCGRVYCIPCVDEIGGSSVLEQVQKASTWECFLCCPHSKDSHGLFKARPNWKEKIVVFFDTGCTVHVPDLEYLKKRRPLRVLSLFDGLGTGKVALDSVGLHIDAYFASETDEGAMLISQANHGQKICQLGDVTKITRSVLKEIAPIDLLIGGSPCNELSMANPARRGFDIDGSGVLFFHFYRVKTILQSVNGPTHLFWLFENVASMKLIHRNFISCFLECQPAVWDAKHFSAQTRTRFFWGNIPGLYSTPEVSLVLQQPQDLDSILHKKCQRIAKVQQLRTMTTNPNSLLQGPQQNILPVSMGGNDDGMWISELERLFGFPCHYTDVGNLTPSKRRVLLGRSWSVPVIAQILRPLTCFFASTSDVDCTTPSKSCTAHPVTTSLALSGITTSTTTLMSVSSSDDAVSISRVRANVTPEEYYSDQPAIGSKEINSSLKENSNFCFEIPCCKNVGEGLIVAGFSGAESCAVSDCLALTTSSALDVTPSYNNVYTNAGSAAVQSLMFSLDRVAVRNTEVAKCIPISSEASSSCDLPCCISNICKHKQVCVNLSVDKSCPKCFTSTVPSATDDGMTKVVSFSKSVMNISPEDASVNQLPVRDKNMTDASAVPDIRRIVSEDDFVNSVECVDRSKLGAKANEVMDSTLVNSVGSKGLSPPPCKLAGEDCNRDSAFVGVSHASRMSSSGFQPQVTSSSLAKVNQLSSFEFHENQNTAFSASGEDHSQITQRNACQRHNAFSFVGHGKNNTTYSQAKQQSAIEELENVIHQLKHNDVTGRVPAVRRCSTSHLIVQPSVLQSAGQNEVTSTKQAACPVTHACYFPFHQVVNDNGSENDDSGGTVENTLGSVSCTANTVGNSSGKMSYTANTLWRPFEVSENAMALELGNATDSGRSFKSVEVAGIDDGYQGNPRDEYSWTRRGDKQEQRQVGHKTGVLQVKQSSNLCLCCSNMMSQGCEVQSYPGVLGQRKQLEDTTATHTIAAKDVQITCTHLNGDESERSLYREFVIPMKSNPLITITVDAIGHEPEGSSIPETDSLGKHAQFSSRAEIKHHGKAQAVNTQRQDIVSIPASNRLTSRENCIFEGDMMHDKCEGNAPLIPRKWYNPRREHVPLVQQGSQQQFRTRQLGGKDGVTMLPPYLHADSNNADCFYSQDYVESGHQHCTDTSQVETRSYEISDNMQDCRRESSTASAILLQKHVQIFPRVRQASPICSQQSGLEDSSLFVPVLFPDGISRTFCRELETLQVIHQEQGHAAPNKYTSQIRQEQITATSKSRGIGNDLVTERSTDSTKDCHIPVNEEDDCGMESDDQCSFVVLGQVFWRRDGARDPVVSPSVTAGSNGSHTNSDDLHVGGRVDGSTMADEVPKADVPSQVLSYLQSFLVNNDAEGNISANTHEEDNEEEESHVQKTRENSTPDKSIVSRNCKKDMNLETAMCDVGHKNMPSKRQSILEERNHTSCLGRKRKPEEHSQTKLSAVSAASPDSTATFHTGAVVTEPVETDETFRTDSAKITACVQPKAAETSQKLQAEHTQLLQTYKDLLPCSENGNASLVVVDEDPQADVNSQAIFYLKSLLENSDAEGNIPEDTHVLFSCDEKTCHSNALDGSTVFKTFKQGVDSKTKMRGACSSTVRKIKSKEFSPMNMSKQHKHDENSSSFMNYSNLCCSQEENISKCSQEECIDEKPTESILSSLFKNSLTMASPVTSEEMTELSENVFERSQILGNTQQCCSVEENLRTNNTGKGTSSMCSFSNSQKHIGASWEKKQTTTMTTLKEQGQKICQKRCSRTVKASMREHKRQKRCSSRHTNTLSVKLPIVDTSLPNDSGNILSAGFVWSDKTCENREIIRNKWLKRLRKRSDIN